MSFDVSRIREDFPVFKQKIHGNPLVYLDNAATSQKPRQVIEALKHYYEEDNSNIHRGVHFLSERATENYEAAREKVRVFLNARSVHEIIFTRGTTESINLVAGSFGMSQFTPGDEVIITALEHHSNIVPWQFLCQRTGARLRVVPMNDAGEILLDEYEKLLSPKTKLVAVAHVSNALGTINPVKKMIEMAHRFSVPVLVDGAQSVPHMRIDVQALDADFYAFSSHKIFGPTGIGVLYGRESLLELMPPVQGGGDMIRTVTFTETTFNNLPYKFEAGTPHIAGAIGLGTALDYLQSLDFEGAIRHENEILKYATQRVSEIKGVRLIGTAKEKASVISFVMDSAHPHDIGTILDQDGIAIRTGHHCAMPVMDRLGIPATARASLAFYNTKEEIDALVKGIHRVKEVFH